MGILGKLNRKWPLSILILSFIAALTSCSEENDFKNAKAGSSESDVDSSGGDSEDSGDSGGSSSTSGVFVISAISGSTTEAGGTATFTVKLNSQPSADVSIAISSSDTTEGTVSPSSIIFTSSNWNTEQTVTVTGVDDSVVDDNVTYNILIGPTTSSDVNYNGQDVGNIELINFNDDVAPICEYEDYPSGYQIRAKNFTTNKGFDFGQTYPSLQEAIDAIPT